MTLSHALACAAVLLLALPVPASAQAQTLGQTPTQTPAPAGVAAEDEVQIFNAFAVVAANGSIVRSGNTELMLVGTIAGPFFVETGEGPQQAGQVTCAISARIDHASRRLKGNGACTLTADDGASAWGTLDCEGFELIGCRGSFKLAGGAGRFAGVTGEAGLVWRPTAHELRRQLDGTTLDNATGILIWRDFKLKTK